jgi:hypothetical protein
VATAGSQVFPPVTPITSTTHQPPERARTPRPRGCVELRETAPPSSDLAGGQGTPARPTSAATSLPTQPRERPAAPSGRRPPPERCRPSKGRRLESMSPAMDAAGALQPPSPQPTPARPRWRRGRGGRPEQQPTAEPSSPPGSPPPNRQTRSSESRSPPSPSPASQAWPAGASGDGEGRGGGGGGGGGGAG